MLLATKLINDFKILQLITLDLQSLIYRVLGLRLKVFKKGLNGQNYNLSDGLARVM